MDDRFDAPVLHREAGPGQHRGLGPSADVSAETGDHVIRDGFHAECRWQGYKQAAKQFNAISALDGFARGNESQSQACS